MNAHVGKRQNSEETVGKKGWGTKQGGKRPDGAVRQKPVGGGKLLLPEEGVTQDNQHKWEQQNRNITADCQKLSADCKV